MNDAILVIRLSDELKQKLIEKSGGNASETVRKLIEKFVKEKEMIDARLSEHDRTADS